ncbi:hypothetical protein O0L34_g14687 [Tuta absoluta]|nr:hypothetical protein O0L34_g14687 [Tuta absoluta]
MSQIVTRKSAVTDEKDKRTDSPVKDMKKKVAANAEKEKQATEKPAEKQTDKAEKPKQTEKPAEKPKQTEKPAEKPKQTEKPAEKKQIDKPAEKNEKAKQPEKVPENKADKSAEKTDKRVEKNGVENKKTEKKDDKTEKNGKPDSRKNGSTSKQNGSKQNGDANGVDDSDDDVLEIPDDDEFPELAYEDSDNEAPSPDGLRSATRRSQVKATRTPETPQPVSEKTPENATTADEPKDKVLKLAEAPPTDRKLRSDDPKEKEKTDDKTKENGEKDGDVIEIEDEEPRKTDTNFSKSRVKVSPYRRSTRAHDHTTSSVMANYTGNNTTMEMDITAETSSFADDDSLNDSYLNGLRAIKGRRSYKPLKELAIKHNRSARSANISVVESPRPTGTVVGRKRKPEELSDNIELAADAGADISAAVHTKRMRLLDRIAQPFRRTLASTPLPNRRNPEIVGINTDLPLSAPVSSPPETFDPETLKAPAISVTPPTPTPTGDEMDKKRCIVM